MQIHVQAVCAVRCSATGKSLSDSSLTVLVDGVRRRYLRRDDGFIVFMELGNGTHRLSFSHPNYRNATCDITVSPGDTSIEVVTMRPLRVSGATLCRLTVTGLQPGTIAWISGQSYPLQLQMKECPAGTQAVRLFQKSAFSLVPPLRLLCADKSAPETCILLDTLGDEMWYLAKPLRFAHRRGVKFFPTQPYEVEPDGTVQAIFFAAGPVSMLYEGQLYELSVKEGDQTWQIPS